MSKNKTQKTTNILLISEQLSVVNFIEKCLKNSCLLNLHKSCEVEEAKTILSNENIHLIILDDNKNNAVTIGTVSSILKDLGFDIPALQLQSTPQPQRDLLNQGASLVVPLTDAAAIQHGVSLLISYNTASTEKKLEKSLVADFKHKFDDLYQTLADPIIFIQDGFFVDCNPAFLRIFEIKDKEELDSYNVLDFVGRKSQGAFRKHLRNAESSDQTATPVNFKMKSLSGEASEFIALSKPTQLNSESVVQMYLRSANQSSGGGGSSQDNSAGLMNRQQMQIILEQLKQKNEGGASIVYLLVRNYRDVWASDGLGEAEKLMSSIALYVKQNMPAHTEISRYTDDGILCYLPNLVDDAADKALKEMADPLRQLSPESLTRMIHPDCFISHQPFSSDDIVDVAVSLLFKTARENSLSEAGDIVSRASSISVATSDNERLKAVKSAIQKSDFKLKYQPIAGFMPDGVERYQGLVEFSDEVQENYDYDVLISLAERHGMMHEIDKWMISSLLNHMLSMDVKKRENVKLFIPISVDALKNEKFHSWLLEQLGHTGLKSDHFIFELTLDNIKQAYKGAKEFAKQIRDYGSIIAMRNLNRITDESEQIIDEIKPSIFKLDIRELESLDESEEPAVMNPIRDKADDLDATLIAENLSSPAQLSRIWPYNITLIQGKGMTPILDDTEYDFNSLAL